jgi:hypothetical protein
MWITRYFSLEELSYSKLAAAVKDSRGSTTAIVAW